MDIKVIGIDIAKRYFQVHAVDASGAIARRRKVSREAFLKLLAGLPPCLIGLEAGPGAHYWAREIAHLGHDVQAAVPKEYPCTASGVHRCARHLMDWRSWFGRRCGVIRMRAFGGRRGGLIKVLRVPVLKAARTGPLPVAVTG
jgi:hypothetical protein